MNNKTVHYDALFVEEAVFRRARRLEQSGSREEKIFIRDYHKSRTLLYEKHFSCEARDEAFKRFTREMFAALGLENLFLDSLGEHPVLMKSGAALYVGLAASRRKEGAELYNDGGQKTIVLLLRAERAEDFSITKNWLRHELWHVTDMLDPVFRYSPDLLAREPREAEGETAREKFRILWDLYVSARIAARGQKPWMPIDELSAPYQTAFSSWDEAVRMDIFHTVLSCRKVLTHQDLWEWARRDPAAAEARV